MRYLVILTLALLALAGCATGENSKVLTMEITMWADDNSTIRGPVHMQKPITTTDSLKGGMTP